MAKLNLALPVPVPVPVAVPVALALPLALRWHCQWPGATDSTTAIVMVPVCHCQARGGGGPPGPPAAAVSHTVAARAAQARAAGDLKWLTSSTSLPVAKLLTHSDWQPPENDETITFQETHIEETRDESLRCYTRHQSCAHATHR